MRQNQLRTRPVDGGQRCGSRLGTGTGGGHATDVPRSSNQGHDDRGDDPVGVTTAIRGRRSARDGGGDLRQDQLEPRRAAAVSLASSSNDRRRRTAVGREGVVCIVIMAQLAFLAVDRYIAQRGQFVTFRVSRFRQGRSRVCDAGAVDRRCHRWSRRVRHCRRLPREENDVGEP